jgi:uncharacterized RmlC-like cupin family protein
LYTKDVAKRVTPSEMDVHPGQTDGMTRAIAISREMTGSVGIYSSIVTTPPGGATRLHHHGPCETSIYVISGRAKFSVPGEVFAAEQGDFVYIPAGELHVEANLSKSEPLVVLVTRNCPDAVTIYAE